MSLEVDAGAAAVAGGDVESRGIGLPARPTKNRPWLPAMYHLLRHVPRAMALLPQATSSWPLLRLGSNEDVSVATPWSPLALLAPFVLPQLSRLCLQLLHFPLALKRPLDPDPLERSLHFQEARLSLLEL
eukprot:CAMPEP_0181235888 /NCGR_PEP_ID=MMETSP1096-20121128/37841_1 /TAXON_ID=156174 ORGANISM="Chrysochromulina ericina, Strain CCMP281" /NCGR_SAMPLE_ID=MMETSP1096 /ASSEMBLY_ACC=CAM_ASM_000453 /LENGTH=129 /DNA_ID=CAMNT_0023330949 /DNA_START=25 /DNA_END=415 /DNA_ORIENTATION=+